MKARLSVYVVKDTDASAPVYRFQPLFFSTPMVSHARLQRGMERFTRELRKHLEQLGKTQDQQVLAGWLYAPPVDYRLLDVTLDLRRSLARCRYLFAICDTRAGLVAFTPSLPHLWFDLQSIAELPERAREVLTHHFREQERQYGEDADAPADHALNGTAWLSTVEFDLDPKQGLDPEETSFLDLMEGGGAPGTGEMDGEEELDRVGRCLDALYPDDLDRVIGNESLLEELERHLSGRDRRPLLLVGPPQVGKTALVHEIVWRRNAARQRSTGNRRQVWLMSPQRLIAGMSYVGQWENRLLAVLDEVKRCKHVLYVDDLLGLFKAGLGAQSSVSVGHLLKPTLERREVRLLAEITLEGWRRLREIDRGFAELFHVMHVREPAQDEMWRVLVAVQRRLEARHRCKFTVDALPMVVELQQRYQRSVAFPGKAASFLGQLAIRLRDKTIDRGEVLRGFHDKSGLPLSFLDRRERLRRIDILNHMKQRIIAQDAALETLADVVSIGRARLNDPARPLGSLLFLGPTGVGKTECAKALAAYLFGSEERLLRFDMNEFSTPASVTRLTGSFYEPEGLLTSAVRRQPFAVVLLDEIEKAHRDVHDLLLQVMGEGRLSDALGRTTDFASTILVMTSNLGVRQAASPLGFETRQQSRDAVYIEAVESFFRPEFVNRIDHLVPFQRLGREAIGRIAELQVQEVFAREGLARRLCMLQIAPAAREQLVEEGYHPLLGARAMRRAIERRLTRPIAARLARLESSEPMLVQVEAAEGGDLSVELRILSAHARDPLAVAAADIMPMEETEQRLVETLDLLEEDLRSWEPEGAVSDADLASVEYRYFLGRDLLQQMRYRLSRLRELSAAPVRAPAQTVYQTRQWSETLGEWLSIDAWRSRLNESGIGGDPAQPTPPLLLLLIDHAYLGLLAEGDVAGGHLTEMVLRPIDPQFMTIAGRLGNLYRETFAEQFGAQVSLQEEEGQLRLTIRGPEVAELARREGGLHVFRRAGESLAPVRVIVDGVEESAVVRLYSEIDATFDLRHGLFVDAFPVPWQMRILLAGALPFSRAWHEEALEDE